MRNDIPLSGGQHRDFPVASSYTDNARDLLARIGGPQMDYEERHVKRLVAAGKLGLYSGAIEVFVDAYRANPDYRPGGHQRWQNYAAPIGYVGITEAATRLSCSRQTLYARYVTPEVLATISENRRRWVSEEDLAWFEQVEDWLRELGYPAKMSVQLAQYKPGVQPKVLPGGHVT